MGKYFHVNNNMIVTLVKDLALQPHCVIITVSLYRVRIRHDRWRL